MPKASSKKHTSDTRPGNPLTVATKARQQRKATTAQGKVITASGDASENREPRRSSRLGNTSTARSPSVPLALITDTSNKGPLWTGRQRGDSRNQKGKSNAPAPAPFHAGKNTIPSLATDKENQSQPVDDEDPEQSVIEDDPSEPSPTNEERSSSLAPSNSIRQRNEDALQDSIDDASDDSLPPPPVRRATINLSMLRKKSKLARQGSSGRRTAQRSASPTMSNMLRESALIRELRMELEQEKSQLNFNSDCGRN